MLEWHAHVVRGAAHDTWMRGRFLEEWADPRVLAQLANVFAYYDRQDIARPGGDDGAVPLAGDRDTECWQYTYPASGDQAVADLVGQLLAETKVGRA